MGGGNGPLPGKTSTISRSTSTSPLRGGVIRRIGFFPGLWAAVAKDPDELIGLPRPGAEDLESTPASKRGDQAPPFLKPFRHLAGLDRVRAQLIRHIQPFRGSEFRLWPKLPSPLAGEGQGGGSVSRVSRMDRR